MSILPGETACLRCLMPEPPPPGASPTCDTAGILGSIVNIVASLQASEAIKILTGNRDAVSRQLTVVDVWENRLKQIGLDGLGDRQSCPACNGTDLPWLSGERASQTAVLCGRNSVQISPADGQLSLDALADKLAGVGELIRNRFLLRLSVDDHVLTVFSDGRAIIGGTDDVMVARTLYAKYVGT
jgi:adenylyltransferase/sulfurtransferase